MNIKKKRAIVIVVALLALTARPQIASAQTPANPIKGTWEDIKSIPPGDELAVGLRNGQPLKGRLINVTDTDLTLAQGKKTAVINRIDALRVYRLVKKSAKKATMIGLGIGAGVGGVSIGVAAASAPGEPKEYGYGVLIYGAMGAGIGALTGYIIGSRKQRVLIYETK
jgi:hypothetical protein